MRKVFWLGLVLILFLFLVSRAATALPYLTFLVGTTSAEGFLDHLSDSAWVAGTDYLDVPQVALDSSGTKYAALGPDSLGGWTAYVWAGNRVTDDTAYDLTINPTGSVHLKGYDAGGNILFDQITSSQFSWTYSAVHATTAQWRTKSNRIEATPVQTSVVPEPSSILVLGMGLSLLGYRRWRR